MLWLENAQDRTDLPRPVVATIGNFDGIHIGQQAILEAVVEEARRRSLTALAVTFEPHPLAVLRPGRAPERVTTPAQKRQVLSALGVDAVAEIAFTAEFARQPAETFVREFLVGVLDAKAVFVGSRFVFGRDREGNISLLRRLGAELGFSAHGVPEVLHGGEPASSTRVRAAVRQGALEEATALLGRPYSLRGTIVRGDGRGKDLGWPTVNLEVDNQILPADGVYTSRIRFLDSGAEFDSVTNVGQRPTLSDGSRRWVETHILEFERDVYGELVELEIWRRLRPEKRFDSADELVRQIANDVDATRHYFSQVAAAN